MHMQLVQLYMEYMHMYMYISYALYMQLVQLYMEYLRFVQLYMEYMCMYMYMYIVQLSGGSRGGGLGPSALEITIYNIQIYWLE